MNEYTLIVNNDYYKPVILHISKNIGEITPMCGKYLGFSYGFVTDSVEKKRIVTKEEILNSKIPICKHCLNKLKNEKN